MKDLLIFWLNDWPHASTKSFYEARTTYFKKAVL